MQREADDGAVTRDPTVPPVTLDRRSAARDVALRAVRQRSATFFSSFGFIFQRALRRDFNAIRLATASPPPSPATPRLVIYTNHPSWWDAAVYTYVCRHFFDGRPIFSPIEASMLRRYPFMARIGAFGVERRSTRGAIGFLAICREILASERNILIIACQGRFADVRDRLELERGIAHLADMACGVTFLPLAIEYTFWDERRPELLLRFGAPIRGDDLAALPLEERIAILEPALAAAMTALAGESIGRDATAFRTLLSGAKGVNPFYDAWRRAKALTTGRRFDPSHGGRP